MDEFHEVRRLFEELLLFFVVGVKRKPHLGPGLHP
jgi:hypothetical protein